MKIIERLFGRGSVSDDQLLSLLREGSELEQRQVEEFLFSRKFRNLPDSYRARLFSRNEFIRETAYSDAFLFFLLKVRLPNFNLTGSLSAFFRKIFFDRLVDEIRREKAMKSEPAIPGASPGEELLAGFSDHSQDILREWIAKIDLEKVMAVLQTEEFQGKDCFRLLKWAAEGLPYEEIAQLTGKTVGTVTVTISKCRKMLISNNPLDKA